MQVFGISDVGLKRQLNEDNFSVWQNDTTIIAVVCDGMGGARAGEVASRLACRQFMQILRDEIERITSSHTDRVQLMLDVDRAIDVSCRRSNEAVFEHSSSDNSLSGMGTTIVGCVIIDEILWAFNVGDSRVYHIDKNGINQLTSDHSFVQALLDAGKITPEEALSHPNRNIILRAVGIEKSVECDVVHMELQEGYYLICSDGLSNYFEEKKFSRIINSTMSLSEKAEALIDFANSSGGADNITAVLIDTQINREVEK
jgi:protein phosphatase